MRRIGVTAAVIEEKGLVLLAKRASGGALGGYWEFPGGKIEVGESATECLRRELLEELGIAVTVGEHVLSSSYSYGEVAVDLQAYRISSWKGPIVLREHDEIAWVERQNLTTYDLAPADIPIAEAIGGVERPR